VLVNGTRGSPVELNRHAVTVEHAGERTAHPGYLRTSLDLVKAFKESGTGFVQAGKPWASRINFNCLFACI
jgi:hypothetical protein